ncbi:MAG: Hsp70 family protein [Myxococcaceae bacterium]|nr:Hsp70 family protein [Myxococcaceae bacterium]
MTTALACQRCNGPLSEPQADSPFVACSYCGTTHSVAPRTLGLTREGPSQAQLKKQAVEAAWVEATAHSKDPVVALRAVVAASAGPLKDEHEAERAARLAESMLRDFDAEHQTSALTNRAAVERVADGAVKAVVELRSVQATEVNLPFLGASADGPKHLLQRVTRQQLDGLAATAQVEVRVASPPASPSSNGPRDEAPARPKRKWWPFG